MSEFFDRVKMLTTWLVCHPQPEHDSLEYSEVLEPVFRPETVNELIEHSYMIRRELLGWSERVDGKNLAVITAGGVYLGLLVANRNSLASWAVLLGASLVIVSVAFAFLGWRPQDHLGLSVTQFVPDFMAIDVVDLKRLILAQLYTANEQIYQLNQCKGRILTRAVVVMVIAAAVTAIGIVMTDQP